MNKYRCPKCNKLPEITKDKGGITITCCNLSVVNSLFVKTITFKNKVLNSIFPKRAIGITFYCISCEYPETIKWQESVSLCGEENV